MSNIDQSNLQFVYSLGSLTRVSISGKDAASILHNVTTNNVKELGEGQGCETFITDVRGKTLGHGFVFRHAKTYLFVGAPAQANRLISHLEKYTIREDATPSDRSDVTIAYLLPRSAEVLTQLDWNNDVGTNASSPDEVIALAAPIVSADSCILFTSDGPALEARLQSDGQPIESLNAFHAARTRYGFPWFGTDVNDSNLPQEIDRDEHAISFTKGCYLGQETVARLDALGKVQRKWVRIEFIKGSPDVGMVFEHEGKPVCRISSVAASPNGTIAYGFARRSHFTAGSQLKGTNQAGQTVSGTVAG